MKKEANKWHMMYTMSQAGRPTSEQASKQASKQLEERGEKRKTIERRESDKEMYRTEKGLRGS